MRSSVFALVVASIVLALAITLYIFAANKTVCKYGYEMYWTGREYRQLLGNDGFPRRCGDIAHPEKVQPLT